MLSTLSRLPYLPDLHDIRGMAGFAISLLLFFALGSAVTPRRTLPEIQLTTGWGACQRRLPTGGAAYGMP